MESGREDDEVPGTIKLVDVNHNLGSLKHNQTGDRDIILHPVPSSDPDDPLNWSKWRKRISIGCTLLYVIAIGIATATIYSVLTPISTATSLTLSQLNNGTGFLFLFLGIANLFWQPLALTFGRRGVYMLSLLGCTAFTIWTPHVKGYGQYIANRILIGIFCAPVESLAEISIADVTFAHQRSTYIGVYMFSLLGSNYFAPIISGFIADGQGWPWSLYWGGIITFGAFLILFFTMEETKFNRSAILEQCSNLTATAGRPEAIYKEPASKGCLDPETVVLVHTRKPYLKRLAWFTWDPELSINWIHIWLRQVEVLCFPIVFWSGFIYGASVIWYSVLNATSSNVFSSAPYNFSPALAGVTYVAPLIGAFLSCEVSGRLGDWLALKLARRNNGVREPEQRLWLYLIAAILCPTGLIIWGVGASRGISWGGLCVGFGMIAFTCVMGGTLPLTYTIDSFKDVSGDAVTGILLIRNIMSFGMNYGITPFIERCGYQNTFVACAFISLALFMTFLIMIAWGKDLRRLNKRQYLRLAATSIH